MSLDVILSSSKHTDTGSHLATQTDRQTERHTYPDTQQSQMDQEPQQKAQIYEIARGESST